MSLEDKMDKLEKTIDRLIGAMGDNTGALSGTASTGKAEKTSTAKGKAAPADKAAAKGKAGKEEVTKDMMCAALTDLKDEFGKDYAIEIVSDVGGAEKMGDIKPAKFAATYKAALAKIAELKDGDGEEEEEDEDEDDI